MLLINRTPLFINVDAWMRGGVCIACMPLSKFRDRKGLHNVFVFSAQVGEGGGEVEQNEDCLQCYLQPLMPRFKEETGR